MGAWSQFSVVRLKDACRGIVLLQLIDVGSFLGYNIQRVAVTCKLTDAEALVAERVSAGMGNKDIADHRDVSPETIRTQPAPVMIKCGASSRVELSRKILNTDPLIS
jgi:DNA-binding NarL/FixJ family response regulator